MSCTIEGEDAYAWNKKRTNIETIRLSYLIDKETHYMRNRELDGGASSSKPEVVERSTTEGVEIAVGTTEGDFTTEVTSSRKLDPPSFISSAI